MSISSTPLSGQGVLYITITNISGGPAAIANTAARINAAVANINATPANVLPASNIEMNDSDNG